MARPISQTEIAIAERFFYALRILKERRVIRGMKTFTRRHGFNQGNLASHKNHHMEDWALRLDYVAFLAQDYGVSCEWLLLGNGDMFVENSPALVGH